MNLFLSCTAVILLHVAVGQKPDPSQSNPENKCFKDFWDEKECKELLQSKCAGGKESDCQKFGAMVGEETSRSFKEKDFDAVLYEVCATEATCRNILELVYLPVEKSMKTVVKLYSNAPEKEFKEWIQEVCVKVKAPCVELNGLSTGKGHICTDKKDDCVKMLREHCHSGNGNGKFCDRVYTIISPELAFEMIPCDPKDMAFCDNIKEAIKEQTDGKKLFHQLCKEDVKSAKCGKLTVSKGWCSQEDEQKEPCKTAVKMKSLGTAKKEISDLADASKFNKEFLAGPSKISTWCDGKATADCKALLELAKANAKIPNNKIVEVGCAIKGNNEFEFPNVCDDVSASSIWAEEGVSKQCTTKEAQEKKEICKIMKGACGVDAYKAKVYCKEHNEINGKLEDQENVDTCKKAASSGKKDELSNCLSKASKICPKAADSAKCEPIISAAFDAIKDKEPLVKMALHVWCQGFPKDDDPKVSDALKDKLTVCYLFADHVDKGSMMDKVFAAKKSDEAEECDLDKTNKFNDNDKHCKFIEHYCTGKTAGSCKVLNENIKTQRWNKDLCADKEKCKAALEKYCIKATPKCQDTIELLQVDHLQDPAIIAMCNVTGSGDHCEKIVDKFIKSKVPTDVVKKTCTEETVGTTFCKTLSSKCKEETAGDECPQIMGYMNSLNKNDKDSADKDEIENLENQILYCQIGAGVGGALCVISLSMCFVCKGMANKSKKKKKGGGSDDSIQL